MAAQPLFLAKEYLPYSKRGKSSVSLKQGDTGEQGEKGESGVPSGVSTAGFGLSLLALLLIVLAKIKVWTIG